MGTLGRALKLSYGAIRLCLKSINLFSEFVINIGNDGKLFSVKARVPTAQRKQGK